MAKAQFPSLMAALNFLAGQSGDRQPSGYANADNAAAVVDIAAPGAGKRILLNSVVADFSDVTVEKALTVIEDPASANTTTVVVSNRRADQLYGMLFGDGKAVRLSLAASGTGGKIGYVLANYSIVDSAQAALVA